MAQSKMAQSKIPQSATLELASDKIEKLTQLLAGIPGVTPEKCHKLAQHWQLLLASPHVRDLTRIRKPWDIALKHYLDCASVLRFMELPSPLLDIGSGAGFPGIVLKILSPETEIILAEGRQRRVQFLESAIAALKLEGISVYPHRVGPQFPHPVEGVITRALESCRDTLYRVQPFLPSGGKVIFLKGPKGEEEIAAALAEFPDFRHEATHRYRLAQTQHERRLIVFTRQHEVIRTRSGTVHNDNAITSRANKTFRMLLSLLDSRGIRKEQKFLVMGKKLVEEIMAEPQLRQNAEAIVRSVEHNIHYPLSEIVLAPALFRELDVLGSHYPLALLRCPQLATWQAETKCDGITIFLPFQDPTNVGAAIRTAAALGAARVVLLREAASPFLPKVVRAAANAIFRIPLLAGPALDELVAMPLPLLRLDLEGKDIHTVEFGEDVLLLAGVEGYGFRSTGNTSAVRIPILNKVESLNAQTALAIALYEIQRRKKA